MKTKILLILLVSSYLYGFGQNKSNLDLSFPVNEITNSQSAQKGSLRNGTIAYESLENEMTGFSLLSDGYFTIGTTNGLSQIELDKNCQITFGHPFALTSYPFFSLDSVVHHPEIYFYDAPKELVNQEDTLLALHATDLEKIDFTFSMSPQNNGSIVRLHLVIRNIDTIAHEIGMGLLYDPALGLWGDGFAFIEGILIQEDTVLQQSIPSSFEIWERAEAPKGMGVKFEYISNLPSKLMLGNWFDLHKNQPPTVAPIYDLGIEMEWPEITVNPDEEVSFTIDIKLESPEFPNSVFMRSDLPHFLSIENNLLFPRNIKSLVKLANNSNDDLLNASLEILGDGFIEDWNSPATINIPAYNNVFSNAFLRMPENYSDKVIMLELNLLDGNEIVDRIKRNVFIPSAPISDSGLIVTIDTIILSEFPFIDLIFRSQIEETGQYLKELTYENVSFYEDTLKIENYILEKDTSGGVNQADIVFVLDVTGSMTDEISGVRDNIVEFADSLSYQGIDFRLGMVTFLDEIENIYDFTTDVQLFQQYVNDQYAHGGGNVAENSLEALMAGSQFVFRPTANRVIIWITDADYHINNEYTQLVPQDVVNQMLTHSIVPHCIGATQYQLDYYNPILFPTGGEFYDINGNFRDILLEISRLNSTGSYRLSYQSAADPGSTYNDIIKINYAGLGGADTITFTVPTKALGINDQASLRYFPNPFYSTTSIEIDNPKGLEAKLEIFNLQGQRVSAKHFESGNTVLTYTWDAKDDAGKSINNGMYFIHCELYDPEGKPISLPVMKLIYLK